MRRVWWAVLPLGMLVASAWAAGQPELGVDVRVEREVRETGKDGAVHTVLQPAQNVHPGDVLVCTAQYRNTGDSPAVSATVTQPVPDGTVLVPNSVQAAGANVEYSMDGKSFGKWPRVARADAGGRSETVDAAPAAVRHVRFVLREPVPPGAGGGASFKVVVQ